MSYFDDNEDRIVFGSQGRLPRKRSHFSGRSDPKMTEVSGIHLSDKDTAAAYAVDTGERDDNDKVVITWLPKSQCQLDPDSTNTFLVPEWLAMKKGLI